MSKGTTKVLPEMACTQRLGSYRMRISLEGDGGNEVMARECKAGTKRQNPQADASGSEPSKSKARSHMHLGETFRRRDIAQPETTGVPRWHNQSYMLFLALRQHPDQSLPRTDLIKAALCLDKRICEERNLPRVFRGKTPMNSASAILTNNVDRYFIPFRPDGSRSMHFRLAYQPGNLNHATEEYCRWQKELATDVWPTLFGKDVKPMQPMTEFDEFLARRHPESQLGRSLNMSTVPTSWRDIVRVGHNNNGVFATRAIPADTPIGYYFGVPMTEDEFDSLKEGVGQAAAYCMMYRRAVLDATDDKGQPWMDPNVPMFCPFHFVNKASTSLANMVFIEGEVVNQVICYTTRDIREGEELLVTSKA